MGEQMRKPNYDEDDETFDAAAYTAKGYSGVAWYVLGWETQPDEDTEWSGLEERTGKVIAIMVGDDRRFTFDEDELTPLDESAYCGGCGQIGCTADGREREA
jgi:hypothetical protein